MVRSPIALFALAASFAGVLGCAHDKAPDAKSPEAVSSPAIQSANTPKTTPDTKTDDGLNVSKEIREACKIVDNAALSPKFGFDEASISPADRDVLTQVATCLTSGPLKGRSVKLVGRADPRGEQEYNMTLGSSRAHAVKTYLAGLGVDGGKLQETSRGELDAKGTDEATWLQDRRVDLDLVP